MLRTSIRCVVWILIAGIVVSARPATTAADDDPPAKPTKAAAETKPATVKVQKGPLTAAVTVKGVVEGGESSELAVRLKAWSGPLVVKKAVEHGTAVKKGDVLVEFETEKLDLAIRDARQERDLSRLAIQMAEIELPILERQAALELAAAKRDREQTAADYKRFQEVDKPLAIESAEFSVKSAEFYLDSAKDELTQLQKMYRDKDLTEETEEMILKRHKFRVEQATFSLKQAMVSRDRSLKIDLPRRETGVKEAVEKAELALAKAQDMQPLMLSQKRLALNKLNYEQNKAEKRLAELEQDREALTVKAPADGLAYHGRYVNGQWMVASGMQGPKLLGGGPIMSDEVFLTIVAPRPLAVRAEVEEKDLHGLKTGVAAKVTPTAFPDKKLTGKLAKKAAAPLNGRFVVRIELEDEASEEIVPGMSCSVRMVTAQKDAALTVPASAVFTDDDEETRYVYLAATSGKPEKKTVKVGLTVGERVEILDGLAEGDEILATKP